jgi:hypothetical protein
MLINIYRVISPSMKWMKNSIKYQYFLAPIEQRLVADYISYGYKDSNDSLRKSKNKNTNLNRVIFDSYPLDKDIVVYRYIKTTGFIEDEFYHTGYISTSIMITRTVEIALKSKTGNVSVMEIIIPRGVHCLWIPSHETEIILPHLTKLKLNREYDRIFSNKTIKFYNLTVIG